MLIQDGDSGEWLQFCEPVAVWQIAQLDQVVPTLAEIETRVNAEGLFAAGFIAYEAAAAFDASLMTHSAENSTTPLLYFGLYKWIKRFASLDEISGKSAEYHLSDWQPAVSKATFHTRIAAIKAAIARGETYQVNYTFPLYADFHGDPQQLFFDLNSAQRGGYGAFLDADSFTICSASPERFFTLDGDQLTTQPMKGTASRGLTLAEDQAQIEWLQTSVKNRAENVMIVDMLRNDVGRVSEIGSVQVPSLFEVTRYPTLLQMTSTVTSRTQATVTELLHALFPCASITGAPKVRTMGLIHELEETPRGVYCGAIGYILPDRQAQFSVAIRTVVVDKRRHSAEYHTGSGVVWDSDATEEYAECLLKADIVRNTAAARQIANVTLLESLRWEPASGYTLLEAHLDRIEASATWFAYSFAREQVRTALLVHVEPLTEPSKVRLLMGADGQVHVESAPLGTLPHLPLLGLAHAPIHSRNLFLYHKTTERDHYDEARRSRPACDDVLLWNERNELCEASAANVVFELDGRLVTPPVSSGLLPGTLRRQLLAAGEIHEQVVKLTDLVRVERVWLINSVRGWREARLEAALTTGANAPTGLLPAAE